MVSATRMIYYKLSRRDSLILHFEIYILHSYRINIFPTVAIKNAWCKLVTARKPTKIMARPMNLYMILVPPLVPNFSSAQALAPKFCINHSVLIINVAPISTNKIPMKKRINGVIKL